MHVILWEFEVKRGSEAEFERAYGSEGDWVRMFRRAAGFLGADLLHDCGTAGRYVTLDRWTTQEAFEACRLGARAEYEALDKRCERLTRKETLLGRFEMLEAPGAAPAAAPLRRRGARPRAPR
ncbi:MAG TPA: antibiotic biosynthesis monooxygenase family protein [Candidatus Polarisedimenticolia bacterium]|nr:antibiotic biosynthesis monooxygenase family protein [Candidatus Polarisedimenticolia bacterium]